MNDLIADLLARIQNAIMRKKEDVVVINTNMNRNILDVLKKEQMIEDYSVSEDGREINVVLSYKNGEPVITSLKRISTS
ncbi:30S ribosomal protein S8, partial [bacterium]|nr:30S ribosomal protein S8 [bacterium]